MAGRWRLDRKATAVAVAFLVETMTEAYSAQRRNTKEPLVPPKPKEFDRAMSIFAGWGLLGT